MDESAVNDWNELRASQVAQKVSVALFVLCKSVVEDDEGALFFNGTAVQRVLLRADQLRPPDELERELMFDMQIKSPVATTHVFPRRHSVVELDRNVFMGSEVFDIKAAPLDVQEHWHWFPFRILKATVNFELQQKFHRFADDGEGVLLCPDLLVHRDKWKVARVQGYSLTRWSKLKFVIEEPKIKIIEQQMDDPGRLGESVPTADTFFTYDQLSLEFYLYESLWKAIFNIIGPLLLVVVLMLVNFHEFYGLLKVWDSCPGGKRDPDYLANAIGVAITVVFVIPTIRADRIKTPNMSFATDDFMTVVFLVGLAFSALPHCQVALAGCTVSSLVVVAALFACGKHFGVCREMRRTWPSEPTVVKRTHPRMKSSRRKFTTSGWERASARARESPLVP